MNFLSSLSTTELQRYHQVVTRSVNVRSHFDLLAWLQGDMQQYLPHQMLIASWGNFHQQHLRHDVISPLAGVRSNDADSRAITPLMCKLHARWSAAGRKPFVLETRETAQLLQDNTLRNAIGNALQTMRSAIVHGIVDERGSNDCLYVGFASQATFRTIAQSAMAVVLPYIDTALRQVAHLPHQNPQTRQAADAAQAPHGVADLAQRYSLTEREAEVLHWVAKGKTNPEIAMILEISSFTVKNHMQRVFRKLDVSNRAQAVGKFHPDPSNVRV